MEDGVGHGVSAGHRVGPQLLHEEDLVGQRRQDSSTSCPQQKTPPIIIERTVQRTKIKP